MRIWRLGLALAAAVALVWILRLEVIDTVSVSSGSMRPTVCEGDRLLVFRVGAGSSAEVGDLVTFHDPVEGTPTLKRVVGVAGQVVEVRDGVLHVDGQPVEESYVDQRTVDGTYFGPVTVPARAVFVMGDEREFSVDSRDYGAISRDAVDGRVLRRLTSACPPEPRSAD